MMPWVTGTFVNTDRKTATTKEDTVYHPGYYLIEMWGGKGGEYYRASSQNTGYRGEAGYIYAVVNLDYNQKIYFTLGGNSRNGEISGSSRGGANGGGYGAQTYPGGGGGYSAFAIDTTSISEATINSGNVLMIVGGGGAGTLSSNQAGGAGGGSSLISNKCFFTGLSASTKAKLVGANPSSSGGAIVITYLGSSY